MHKNLFSSVGTRPKPSAGVQAKLLIKTGNWKKQADLSDCMTSIVFRKDNATSFLQRRRATCSAVQGAAVEAVMA